jgi:hypothetical protein
MTERRIGWPKGVEDLAYIEVGRGNDGITGAVIDAEPTALVVELDMPAGEHNVR